MADRLLLATAPVEADRTSARHATSTDQATNSLRPIIQAQSEVIGTMLKAMIIASGGRVEGSEERR